MLFYVSVLPQTSRWVIGIGKAAAVNISVNKARKLALERARINALQKIELAVESRIQFLRAENGKQLLSSFIQLNRTAVRGRIVREDTLEWKKYFSGDIPVYEVKLRVIAVPELGRPDPGFLLQLNLNQTSFRSGEEMTITVRSTRDCYLYLFNLIQGDTIIQIFPNALFKDNFLHADSLFIFPPSNLRKFIGLEVKIAPGQSEVEEVILAVATRKKIPFTSNKSPESTSSAYIATLKSALFDLNKWLLQFRVNEFTEALQMYRVFDAEMNRKN